MRWSTDREGGGVLTPDGVCTNTGCPVKEVLQEKHPPLHEIDDVDPNNSTFEVYGDIQYVVPLAISGAYFELVVRRLNGSSRPGGVDTKFLVDCYT